MVPDALTLLSTDLSVASQLVCHASATPQAVDV